MNSLRSSVNRPITSRPLTSARALPNTGLIAPKSSRGKTGLRRQIQDKSYFIGVLRSKINEINGERNVLLKECEIMSKEEARIGVYRQKAETLAKELGNLTLELATYNEFLDRIRVGDNLTAVREDAHEKKVENKALIANLENSYSSYKSSESKAKQNEEELQNLMKSLNSIKDRFSEEQRAKFSYLQNLNTQLTKESQDMENEISIWKEKKIDIEESTLRNDNLLKMEMMQAVAKLKRLKRQKEELSSTDDTEENERSNLLAQVKRDNNYIASLEAKIEQFKKNIEEMKSEMEFYKDGEKLSRFSDLKQKEKSFADFQIKFETEKEDLLNRMESVNNEINDISNKLSRSLKYLTILKQINEANSSSFEVIPELVIKRRKIQLELNQNQQMKTKLENEREILNSKIQKLRESVESYSDITKLKTQIESNLSAVKKAIDHLRQENLQIKTECETISSEVREIRIQLEKDDTYQEITRLEDKLANILKTNEGMKSNDSSQMMAEIKSIVLENTKKYNQNLMGF